MVGGGGGERTLCKKRLESIIPAEVMWNGVGDPQVLESSGVNSVVVTRVTPRPKAVVIGVGKYCRMVHVRSI